MAGGQQVNPQFIMPLFALFCTSGSMAGGQQVNPQFIMPLFALFCTSGSMAGGQQVDVTGRGFDDETTITICGELCDISSDITPTTLTCRTPAYSGVGTGDVDCDVKAFGGNYKLLG